MSDNQFLFCEYCLKNGEKYSRGVLERVGRVTVNTPKNIFALKLISSVTKRLLLFKASLTFKCMTEHLFADFSYSIALDTYLWKQMMQMNRKLIHIWYNVDKKHLLFTKRKCHKFSWLFTASRCSPRRRPICACRIAYKVLVSIGVYSLSFGFLKKKASFLENRVCKKGQVKVTLFPGMVFQERILFWEN